MYKCIEERAHSVNDLFNQSEANDKYFNISTSSNQVKAKPFYLGVEHGLPHSLQIESGVINLSVWTSLHLAINANITSTIMITDPKLQFAAFNPEAIPKTKLTLEQNKGMIVAYLKVSIPHLYCKYEPICLIALLIQLGKIIMLFSLLHNVQVIRHELLDRPHSPCDPSPDYDFGLCVERSMMRTAGCQPPWARFPMLGEEMPLCHNWSQLNEYG